MVFCFIILKESEGFMIKRTNKKSIEIDVDKYMIILFILFLVYMMLQVNFL